jgi:hypothetical protein
MAGSSSDIRAPFQNDARRAVIGQSAHPAAARIHAYRLAAFAPCESFEIGEQMQPAPPVIALAAGIMGSTLGLSGVLFSSYAATRYNMPELADPSDHLAHLTAGVLALWAWSNRKIGHQSSATQARG